jgi:hypothetical protein
MASSIRTADGPRGEQLHRERLAPIYLASVVSKIVTLLNRALLLPFVATLLLPREYAAFTLLLSAVAFVAGLDVGLGGGALQQISRAFADRRYSSLSAIARRVYCVTTAVVLGSLMLVGAILTYIEDVSSVERMLGSLGADRSWSVIVFAAAVLTQCLFNVGVKMLQGVAQQSVANLLGAGVNIALAIAIMTFAATDGTDGVVLGQICVASMITFQSFGLVFAYVKISRIRDLGFNEGRDFQPALIRHSALFRDAVPFAVLAAAVFVERESLKWVLSEAGDQVEVARFAVFSNISLSFIGVVQLVLIPFWPMLLTASASARPALWSRIWKASAAVALVIVFGSVCVSYLGPRFAAAIWGSSYAWASSEWYAFGFYLLAGIPKHIFFPVLAGLRRVPLVAVTYFMESVAIIAFLTLEFPQLDIVELFYVMGIISLVVTGPVFSVVCLQAWKRAE